MKYYTVYPNGGGGEAQFASVQKAVDAAPNDEATHIFIRNGVYREKLVCEKQNIMLEGESREGTLLVWADGARHFAADGTRFGTFRTQTAFFDGEQLRVKNITIANTAGSGEVHGQAIAAAVYTKNATFENVAFLGWQDTLFTGPLPEKERLANGFLGPRQTAPRVPSGQVYENCFITGDIDFVFGGADALFKNCEIVCRGTQGGFIAAPSTEPHGSGYLFLHCDISGEEGGAGKFYLARPWRAHGKAAFLYCKIGDAICAEGFDDWGETKNRKTSTFCEFENILDCATSRAFGTQLTKAQANALCERANALAHSSKE